MQYLFHVVFLTLLFYVLPFSFKVCNAQESSVVEPQPVSGEPLQSLTNEQKLRFKRGKAAFEKSFDGTVEEGGVGPLFNSFSINSISCVSCHGNGGVGGGGGASIGNVTRFGQQVQGGAFNPLESLGGSLLQMNHLANCNEELIPTQANIKTIRSSTTTFGDGLIESILDSDLLANEIHGGRAHKMKALEDPNGPLRVGRFGWKAQLPTVMSFSADAASNEMGISNPILPLENQPNSPAGYSPCADGIPGVDDVPTHDMQGVRFIDELTDFMRYLGPPSQTPKSGMRGEQVFNELGCAVCHVPFFTTPLVSNEPALSQKTVKAYSDFLLHDMGGPNDISLGFNQPRGGDGIVQGQATQRFMRTAPLWGLSNVRAGFFHNEFIQGNSLTSNTLDKIILFHASSPESPNLQNNYNSLKEEHPAKIEDLLNFLKSLGQREFDSSRPFGAGPDSQVDEWDFQLFRACFEGSKVNGTTYTPDDACALHDINQDGTVDLQDAMSFLKIYKGKRIFPNLPQNIQDCQCDNIADLIQILNGTSADNDNDSIPDECSTRLILATFFNNGLPEIINGQITITPQLYGLRGGEQADIYYSFAGEGITLDAGSCVNLSGPIYSIPFTNNNIDFIVPPGKDTIYLQVKSRGGNRENSNMVKLELFCKNDVECDGIKNKNDNCPYAVNTNQADINHDNIGDVCTTPYDNWAAQYFPLANTVGRLEKDNPDGDAYSNVWEYAFNLNPTIPESTIKPFQFGLINNHFTLQYRRNIQATDFNFEPESSTDLKNWNSNSFPLANRVVSSIDANTQLITATDPAVISGNKFFRLKVTRTTGQALAMARSPVFSSSLDACPDDKTTPSDALVPMCFRGRTIQVPYYLKPRYFNAGAKSCACP